MELEKFNLSNHTNINKYDEERTKTCHAMPIYRKNIISLSKVFFGSPFIFKHYLATVRHNNTLKS